MDQDIAMFKEVVEKRKARRNFMRQLFQTGAVAAGAVALTRDAFAQDQFPGFPTGTTNTSTTPTTTSTTSPITDVDILNFALNLEYLEAEFYTVATTGMTIAEIGIPITGIGNAGPTTGGQKVELPVTGGDGDNDWDDSPQGQRHAYVGDVALELAYDEQQHVMFLQSALGSAGVAKPAINLDALGVGFADYKAFLTLARAFEDVGVSAYAGAAPLISSKTYLGAAAQILATEALHSGNIRLQIALNNITVTALDSLDVVPPPAGKQYFTTGPSALAVVRTPSQVLAIVYANSTAGTTSGGFFPNGVNGNINSV